TPNGENGAVADASSAGDGASNAGSVAQESAGHQVAQPSRPSPNGGNGGVGDAGSAGHQTADTKVARPSRPSSNGGNGGVGDAGSAGHQTADTKVAPSSRPSPNGGNGHAAAVVKETASAKGGARAGRDQVAAGEERQAGRLSPRG